MMNKAFEKGFVDREIPKSGLYDISFDLKSSNGEEVCARIYKNSYAYGTLYETGSLVFTRFGEQLSFEEGDSVCVYLSPKNIAVLKETKLEETK